MLVITREEGEKTVLRYRWNRPSEAVPFDPVNVLLRDGCVYCGYCVPICGGLSYIMIGPYKWWLFKVDVNFNALSGACQVEVSEEDVEGWLPLPTSQPICGVTPVRVRGSAVRLSFDSPDHVHILREELLHGK